MHSPSGANIIEITEHKYIQNSAQLVAASEYEEQEGDEIDFNFEDDLDCDEPNGVAGSQRASSQSPESIITDLRIRRVFSKYSLWRTKSDRPPTSTSVTTQASTMRTIPLAQHLLCRSSLFSGRSSASSLVQSTSNPSSFTGSMPSLTIEDPQQRRLPPVFVGDHDAAPNDQSTEVASATEERKLCQSLVLPLVLGCVIFLVVVWTRQVSLVLKNDTVVMIVILALVFIVISGVAFWLSYDQQLVDATVQQEIMEDNNQQQQSNHHHCHHHRHHSHHHRCPLHHQQSAESMEHSKWCGVSIIDCQPPDYYTALNSSLPIHLLVDSSSSKPIDASEIELGHGDKSKLSVSALSTIYTGTWSSASTSSCSPPSYDEFLAASAAQSDSILPSSYHRWQHPD